jgi:hypothetical protein
MTHSEEKKKAFKSFITSAFSIQCHSGGIIEEKMSEESFVELYGFSKVAFDEMLIGINLFVDHKDNTCLQNYIK